MSAGLPGMGGDFAKGASGPGNVYDTSPTGLGLSPAYLAPGAVASATSSGSGSDSSRIFDYTASGAVASIDSDTILGGNLPSTFTHLRLVIAVIGDSAGANLLGRFNNDSGTNYDYDWISASSATVDSTESNGQTAMHLGPLSATANSGGTASVTAGEILIPNYNGAFWKVANADVTAAYASGSGGRIKRLTGNAWRSTAAITRITLLPDSGNFAANTVVTLYGLN